jgi:uracil phosphoribosyltransferase
MKTKSSPPVILVQHPLAAAMLTRLRDWNTPKEMFRQLVADLSVLVFLEMTRSLAVKSVWVDTPLAKTKGMALRDHLVLVPILRAGLGMLAGVEPLVPGASIGHLGLYRDEKTLQPHRYYAKLPSDLDKATVCILDPMLATGHSACAAVEEVKKRGARRIHFGALIAAPEGIRELQRLHPHVGIVTAGLDKKLNAKGYIVPGLGDAGDRLFGT